MYRRINFIDSEITSLIIFVIILSYQIITYILPMIFRIYQAFVDAEGTNIWLSMIFPYFFFMCVWLRVEYDFPWLIYLCTCISCGKSALGRQGCMLVCGSVCRFRLKLIKTHVFLFYIFQEPEAGNQRRSFNWRQRDRLPELRADEWVRTAQSFSLVL